MSNVIWRKNLKFEIDPVSGEYLVVFQWDWTDWLAEVNGDTIQSVVVTAGTGLVVSDVSNTDTSVYHKIAPDVTPPVVGSEIACICKITTAGGQTRSKTVVFVVVDQ